MFILLGFYRRKPELSVTDFRRIWSKEYGPLYDHPDIKKHLRRYVQHRLSPLTEWPTRAVEFDGIAESWFDSMDARRAMHAEPYFQEVLKPMVESFLDLENSNFAAQDDQAFQVGSAPLLVRA